MIPALGGDIALAKTQPVSTVQSHNVPKAIEKARDYLLNRQQSKGFWVGELEGDITLESDYVILQIWLHQPNKKGNWSPPTRSRIDDAYHHILKKQLTDGGWNLFPGGPANVSASVKAYFALKLGGIDSHEECM